MAQGKFSQPRPHRDEERQIEQAFRQVTGQEPAPQPQSPLLNEDAQIEQAFHQVKEQATASRTVQRPAANPRNPQQESFDLLPEDVDAFFEGNTPAFEEEPYDSEPDFVDKMMAFFNKAADYCKKNQKVVMVSLCAVALILIVVFIAIICASAADPYDKKILENVFIADIDVGGMTKNEAISAVKEATSSTYTKQDMVIDLSGTELRLSPKDTDAALDVKSAVNEAYDYGRTGTKAEKEKAVNALQTEPHIINLLPYLDLDTKYISELLNAYAGDSGSTLTQATYGLEGEEPELSADKFDEDAPTQTLVITMGTPGVGFDANQVYNEVLDAYGLHVFLVEVETVEDMTEPDPVDLQAIYDEFYIEPVNATIDMQTYKTEPGSYGYGFDLKEAQKLIDKAEYGEEVRIPMEYIEPDILDDDAFFRDTLGEHKTRTTSNDNRNTNLRLACEAIDGTVLNPGESLSFSSALSNSKGYTSAPEDTGKESSDKGGVSQVSSTLYYAALVADLDITSRSNHGYIPSFIETGLDATASLKIRNNTSFPIRIDAEVSGGYVKIQIIGTEERDYYVILDSSISNTYQPTVEYKDFKYDNEEGYIDGDVIEEGTTGYLVKSYKVKYATKTGAQLSRDFLTNSQYPAENRIVARVEAEPTTEATEPPTETTKPTETTTPSESTEAPTTEPTTEPTTAPTSEPTTTPTVESSESQQEEAPVSDAKADTDTSEGLSLEGDTELPVE